MTVSNPPAHRVVEGTDCCSEFARLQTRVSRRGVLGGALSIAGGSAVYGSAVLTASPASAEPASAVMVVLSMRGAADGLSLVVPHGDPAYYVARPKIAIPSDRLVAKDGFFGLHPALAPLVPLWNKGQVAAVHATGLPTVNRSHFAAQEELEDADPGSRERVGWINRLIGNLPGSSPFQGFSSGRGALPTSLYGPETAMGSTNVDSIAIPGLDPLGRRIAALHQVWDNDTSPLGAGMRTAFGAVDSFAPVQATAKTAAKYPVSDLGTALANAARIVRGNVGVEVITVDHGDWDMHSRMGTADGGWMVDQASELATALAVFMGDLGDQASKVTVVTVSEFGRRVVENSNYGTDHGYGNVMFVLGAGVRGGYHAAWPGLTATSESDLLVTTDYRQVFADLVQARFGASSAAVFPGLSRASTGAMLGV